MDKKRLLEGIGIVILVIIAMIWLIRLFSPRQLDDLSPEIPCSSDLIEKSGVLYIIPEYDGWALSKEFCQEILALNKTIAMHGVTHEYKEFLVARNSSYIEQGIEIFSGCFNFTPSNFKPPQLAISKENEKLVRKYMNLDLNLNQIAHKVYHCGDTGLWPNWLIDII